MNPRHPSPELPRRHGWLLWLALVAAGLAGNYFRFPLFLNIDILFGSIFAMLALQFFGLGRGVAAATLIAASTYFLWNHPWAAVIMSAEVAVVGVLMQRRQIGMVLADTLYWLFIGIPLVYFFYRFVMQGSLDNTAITMTKQAVNGIANALVARLIFVGLALRSNRTKISFRELIYNLMAFFVLCPALIMLAVGSRSDFEETDHRMRTSLSQEQLRVTDLLAVWVGNRRSAMANLAEIAALRTPAQMQTYLEQAKKSDVNFLRVGRVDRDAVTTAFFPLVDELGHSNIGKNLADRPFIPTLQREQRPLLTEVYMSRIGNPKPMVTIVAPVLSQGTYDGFVTGVLSLEQIADQIASITRGEGTLYTLLDKNDRVILSNRTDQTAMQAFARGAGTLVPLDGNMSQWVPLASINKPVSERWKNSFYIAESRVGDLADWRLVLDQPVAPVQKALFDNYAGKLGLLFVILVAALALAELLSRRAVATLEELGALSRDMAQLPVHGAADRVWPQSGVLQTHELIQSFKAMSESMGQQLREIERVNASLEARVQQRTALLQGILDHIPVGVSAFDGALDLIAHNRLFRENLELPDALFVGGKTRFEDIIRFNVQRGEYGAGDPEALVARVLERTRPPVAHQFERLRPNGVTLEVRGAPLPGGGFVTTHADVSERKRVEREVQRNADLLRGAIEALDEAFVLYDPEDRLVFCNEKYRQMYQSVAHLMVTGASFETLVRKGAELGHYSDAIGRVDEWVAERVALHRASNTTLIQRHETGRVVRIVERKLADGHIVGFRIDITDLVHATEAAQAANVAKSRFLATMSHEIRTPMNGILGMAQLLLMPQLVEAERRDYARTIVTSGQTLLTLLNDILDLSKIEAGKLELEAMAFEPGAVLRDIRALFAGAAQLKGLELDCHWTGPAELRYQSDSHRLRQMLSNLVGNAIKFTAGGSIRIEGLELGRDAASALLEFSVTDTGVGIAADKIALLFKPFSQADSSTTREFGGSGLGLSIVSHLAQAMGGEAGVQSEPGQGSRFWFRVRVQLPVAGEDSRRAERAPELACTVAPGLSGSVLVVEDNPVNRLFVQALLGKLGLQVAVAHDGQQALDRVMRGERPDAVLMDINMPVLDGYGATERIRQWESANAQSRLPIIALTADAFEEDRQHCLAVGMDDFLTKPVQVEALKSALLKWLPQAPRPAPESSPQPALGAIDRLQFAALAQALFPLLEQNKFDAISRFKKLQALAHGTAQQDEVDDIGRLLRSLQFQPVLARLRALAARLDAKESA